MISIQCHMHDIVGACRALSFKILVSYDNAIVVLYNAMYIDMTFVITIYQYIDVSILEAYIDIQNIHATDHDRDILITSSQWWWNYR